MRLEFLRLPPEERWLYTGLWPLPRRRLRSGLLNIRRVSLIAPRQSPSGARLTIHELILIMT